MGGAKNQKMRWASYGLVALRLPPESQHRMGGMGYGGSAIPSNAFSCCAMSLRAPSVIKLITEYTLVIYCEPCQIKTEWVPRSTHHPMHTVIP